MTLGSSSQKAGTFASQVVSAIAAVELPAGHWPDLIEILLGFVNNQANENLRIATLQTIGFICEAIVSGVHNKLMSTVLPGLSLETRDLKPAFQRDPDRCHPWSTKGGAFGRGATGSYSRSV